METKKVIVNENTTASQIDFSDDLKGLGKKEKKEVLRDIGELLVEQTLSNLADAKSPITGRSFKGLSKDYADKKKAETGSTKANLDLTGEMINSIDFEIEGEKLLIGVFGSDAPKADGHNNLSGESKLPKRQFLPNKGENYESDIRDQVAQLIAERKADSIELNSKKLEDIDSKQKLYDYLSELFATSEKSVIRSAVLQSDLIGTLEDFDLLKYL